MNITTNPNGSVTLTLADGTVITVAPPASVSSAAPSTIPAIPDLPQIFADDFATGDLSHLDPSGCCWAGVNLAPGGGSDAANGAQVGVVNNALAFTFPAQPQGGQCIAEQDGYLGALRKAVRVQFSLAVPSNYLHRGGGSQYPSGTPSSNNKLLALYRNPNTPGQPVTDWNMVWSTTLCTWPTPTGGSSLGLSFYDNDVEQPVIPFAPDFITSADLGKTMDLDICMVMPEVGQSNGQFWFAKNGSVLLYKGDCDNQTLSDNLLSSFYLLGASNSGFTDETVMQISNVRICGQ